MDNELYKKILSTVGIVDVMNAYGFKLKKKGKDFWCLCPFHTEKHPSFNVSPSKNICKCFSCNKPAMTPLQFIVEKEGVSKKEALKIMADIGNIYIPGEIEHTSRFKPVPHYECEREETIEEEEQYVEINTFLQSCNENFWSQNPLYQFMSSRYPREDVNQVFKDYFVGTSKSIVNHSQGNAMSVVFWQIDAEQQIRAGKITPYTSDGHRVRDPNGKDITWVHTVMNKKITRLRQCLYGMHLLNKPHRTIFIVESEKTALEMRLRYMHEWPQAVWLATAGKGGAKRIYEAVDYLMYSPVTLCPDIDAYTDWMDIWHVLQDKGVTASIDNTLVNHGVSVASKTDIADYASKIEVRCGQDSIDKNVVKRWADALIIINDIIPDATSQFTKQAPDISAAIRNL